MIPYELHVKLTEIIQQETGCSASWAQHPEPLTMAEVWKIRERVANLLVELSKNVAKEFRREQASTLQ